MVESKTVISTEWAFLAIAYICLGARLAVRWRLKQSGLLVSDLWLVLAALSVLGLVICDTLAFQAHAMDDFSVANIALNKSRFAVNYFFDLGLYFPKLSILAFYYKLVPVTKPLLRMTLLAATGLTAGGALFALFADTFWCGADVSVNWSEDPDSCSSFHSVDLFKINWAFNITCEWLIFAIPFPLLRDLVFVSWREKAALTMIFALGLFTIGLTTARFIVMVETEGLSIYIYIWATVEFTTAIIVASLPSLRPLLRSFSRHVGSNRTGAGWRSTGRGAGSSGLPTKSRTIAFSRRLRQDKHRRSHICTEAVGMSGSDTALNRPEDEGEIHKMDRISVASVGIDGAGRGAALGEGDSRASST